jgi:hypothetical protein
MEHDPYYPNPVDSCDCLESPQDTTADAAPPYVGATGFVLSRRRLLLIIATVPAAGFLLSEKENRTMSASLRPAMFFRKCGI